ncbi:MAG: ATP-binding cassette domain-containing protein [Candidatus Aegiribacteria sp.]|nr:ATP-binding cassette domain-containing protein [Candidatus Aegiribacteria sp.]
MNIIEARNIERSFDDLRVLSGLDIDVAKGEFLAIVGRSGVGKSTLLAILGTHDLDHGGTLKIAEKPTDGLSSSELAALRREYLGFVFQDFHLLPALTATENVILPTVFSGGDLEKARTHALDILGKLSVRTDETPTSLLSRGERQRVAVARGLVNRPSVLLADEPSASLDEESENILFDLLDELRRQQNFALIAVVHSTGVLDRADRILELKDGILHETV